MLPTHLIWPLFTTKTMANQKAPASIYQVLQQVVLGVYFGLLFPTKGAKHVEFDP